MGVGYRYVHTLYECRYRSDTQVQMRTWNACFHKTIVEKTESWGIYIHTVLF